MNNLWFSQSVSWDREKLYIGEHEFELLKGENYFEGRLLETVSTIHG